MVEEGGLNKSLDQELLCPPTDGLSDPLSKVARVKQQLEKTGRYQVRRPLISEGKR